MLPKYEDIELPLMRELARRGGAARPADRDASARSVYEALADYFHLTASDLAETIYENGKPRSKWENMVRYAVRSLRNQGRLRKGGTYGVWELVDGPR